MNGGVTLALGAVGVLAAAAGLGRRTGSRTSPEPPDHVRSCYRHDWRRLAALPAVSRRVPFRKLPYETRESLVDGCWHYFRLQRGDLERRGLFELDVVVFPTPPVPRTYTRGWMEWAYRGDAYVEEMAKTMRELFPPTLRADPEAFMDAWLAAFPPLVLERPLAIPLDGSHRSQAALKERLPWVPAVSCRSWLGEPGERVEEWRWGREAQQSLFLPWERDEWG